MIVRLESEGLPYEEWRADDDADWSDFRRLGIGGSDVASIMGINRYRSPMEVWLEKTGRKPSPDLSDNEKVEWGNRLEGAVRQKFRDAHPELEVTEMGVTLVDKARPWAHANLDGRIQDGDSTGVLEIKTVGAERRHDWDDGVPDYYMAQVTHYLAVTGWGFAYVAALFGGQHYEEWRIERDEDDVSAVSDLVDTFWHGFVEADVPPQLVGTGNEARALLDSHQTGAGESAPDDVDEFNTVAWDYERHRRDEADAKRAKDMCANRLRGMVGDNKSLVSDIFRVTWSRRTTTRLDQRRLRKERPEIFEEYSVTSVADGGVRVTEIGGS